MLARLLGSDNGLTAYLRNALCAVRLTEHDVKFISNAHIRSLLEKRFHVVFAISEIHSAILAIFKEVVEAECYAGCAV